MWVLQMIHLGNVVDTIMLLVIMVIVYVKIKGAEISYDNIKGVLKEIGLFDILVYIASGLLCVG